MCEPRAIAAALPIPQVRSAIARASQATGVDFAYLLGEARLESSLDPNAKAATSSAAGLYQFTGGTWLQTLDRHGAEHGLGWAGDAISAGWVTDPAQRASIMALRYDPGASALMARSASIVISFIGGRLRSPPAWAVAEPRTIAATRMNLRM